MKYLCQCLWLCHCVGCGPQAQSKMAGARVSPGPSQAAGSPWLCHRLVFAPQAQSKMAIQEVQRLHLDHFRRQVVKGPAEGLTPGVGGMHRPAKVRNLELSVQPQQQVLRLDVSMDHMLGMAVHQGLCQRCHIPAAPNSWAFVRLSRYEHCMNRNWLWQMSNLTPTELAGRVLTGKAERPETLCEVKIIYMTHIQ